MEPVDLVRLPEESRRSPPRRVPPPNRRGGADHAAGRHEGDLVERLDLRCERPDWAAAARDRKSTRLNSSHSQISYAVFCLKKKKKKNKRRQRREIWRQRLGSKY